ncbi:hypothetical protein [Hymenobacter negativus]|uniref:Lipoprotein n=1 Tax=Hymenobacter negativus TaxID=2795026 RepID=A0ABS3Q8K6_9BACT|nr:hypothetical protein [Hymenobacter negativus]MBO2007572.1 hypothetical protein [Hymenobacter negativus]
MAFSFFRCGCCALLSVLLVGCTDPKAFRVEGPSTEGHGSSQAKQLNYTVYNFAPTDSCYQVLRNMAYSGVVDDGSSGTFQVTFTDATTKRTLMWQTMEVYPDLLFQNKQPVITSTYGGYR